MDVDEELKKTKKDTEKLKKELNKEEIEKLKKKLIEKMKKLMNEEMKKLLEMKDEELKNDNNEELKKVRKDHNEELQKLITQKDEILRKGLRDLSDEGFVIRVKRMGEVDEKPFLKLQHAMLCSKWQKNLKDQAWYPFKRVGDGEKMKEVVDDENEKLKKLREEWGEDVKNAVKTALEELNEFNPSGRYTVPVLWNFEHGRKATLKEGIAHLTQQIKNRKRT
ncbi:hypothetical protein N665_0071s0034 [Sinapis alba]|nr:hypothetical protein N665_0071s0034 [Sinapis alba]